MSLAELKKNFEEKLKEGGLRVVKNDSANLNLHGLRLVKSNNGTTSTTTAAAAPAREKRVSDSDHLVAITNAASVWAEASTNKDLARARDVVRDKLRTVREFFLFLDIDLLKVTPIEVGEWQAWLEHERGLSSRTIYNYSSHLSSFYEWLRDMPEFKSFIRFNPVRAAFPSCPAPYQSQGTRSLSDEALRDLWRQMEKVRKTGSAAALRDYAIFRFFAATGDRRSEIINLRGMDVELRSSGLIYYPRVKGGARIGKTITDREVANALLEYIKKSGRREKDVFGLDTPLWLSHDNAGRWRCTGTLQSDGGKTQNSLTKPARAAKGLTSHAFALRMKAYAERASVFNFHLHMLRHTFARIVSEETESLSGVQEALGHKNMKTTRIYVASVEIRGDKHSARMKNRARREKCSLYKRKK